MCTPVPRAFILGVYHRFCYATSDHPAFRFARAGEQRQPRRILAIPPRPRASVEPLRNGARPVCDRGVTHLPARNSRIRTGARLGSDLPCRGSAAACPASGWPPGPHVTATRELVGDPGPQSGLLVRPQRAHFQPDRPTARLRDELYPNVQPRPSAAASRGAARP